MRKFSRFFRRDTSGMTTIEYALLAGVMGTGVLMSINYVADELTAMIQPEGCTWVAPEEGAEDQAQRCIGAPGWTPRRARPPQKTLSASSSD